MLKRILLLFFALHTTLHGAPSHVVSLFIDVYPTIDTKKETVANSTPNWGIPLTYFGFKTSSDRNGQALFQLKTQTPQLFLLVAKNPQPIFMLYNTIHHWEMPADETYALYTVERKFDEHIKLYFWDVQKTSLPEDKKIPMNTIIVHASPDEIYVPTGITLTTDSHQLVLPTIYAKPTIDLSKNSLLFLENNEFFAQTERAFQKGKTETQTHI